jgi:asparagine synthase (glutamine-hydrolysing)
MDNHYVERVIDLTDQKKNIIYNMSNNEAIELIRKGDLEAVRKIDGQFSLVSVDGKTVKMARSIGRPLRYFIAIKNGRAKFGNKRTD